jgi:uncharacterized membrane protein YozB (DUF420 family)
MKELLASPGFLAHGTLGADISYLLAVTFTALFLTAWVLAKKGLGTKHHRLVFISMLSMVIYFCAYYFARQLGVLSLEGKEGFGGPESVYNNVFIPILNTHLVLVFFGLVMAIYMVFEGFRASTRDNGEVKLKAGDLRMRDATFKKTIIAVGALWAANQLILTFVRGKGMAASIAWAFIFWTVPLVLGIEKLIEKSLPDGARRHRVLGRATMVIFALILVTSTLTYLMLYVIYPTKH